MITISEYFWQQTLDEFSGVRRAVEQVCYFDGITNEDGGGVVTTLTLPNARLHADHFHVEPEAMSQAGKHLRTLRLRRLAQVHTHPDAWTGHSPWDNQWAYSQLPGAISIVLPYRGQTQPSLADAGVHLRTETGWRHLGGDEVLGYLRRPKNGRTLDNAAFPANDCYRTCGLPTARWGLRLVLSRRWQAPCWQPSSSKTT